MKIVAAQLGFKGKDGLVVEPRTSIQEDERPGGPGGPCGPSEQGETDTDTDEHGSRTGLGGNPRLAVEEDQCEDLGGDGGEPHNAVNVVNREGVEIPDAENRPAGWDKNGKAIGRGEYMSKKI